MHPAIIRLNKQNIPQVYSTFGITFPVWLLSVCVLSVGGMLESGTFANKSFFTISHLIKKFLSYNLFSQLENENFDEKGKRLVRRKPTLHIRKEAATSFWRKDVAI